MPQPELNNTTLHLSSLRMRPTDRLLSGQIIWSRRKQICWSAFARAHCWMPMDCMRLARSINRRMMPIDWRQTFSGGISVKANRRTRFAHANHAF